MFFIFISFNIFILAMYIAKPFSNFYNNELYSYTAYFNINYLMKLM